MLPVYVKMQKEAKGKRELYVTVQQASQTPSINHTPNSRRSSSRILLRHRVQSASILEPFNLWRIESVSKLDIKYLSILGVDSQSHGLTHVNFSAQEINLRLG